MDYSEAIDKFPDELLAGTPYSIHGSSYMKEIEWILRLNLEPYDPFYRS